MSSTTVPARTADALPAGYDLHGYEIVRVLGRGGFGITYEAYSPVTERRVAIKEFYPHGLASRDASSQIAFSHVEDGLIEWALDKFRATTTLLARMEHPNILRVDHYVPMNGTGYMITEYLEGETLQGLVRRHGALSPERLRPILEPVLDALTYVHAQGLVHRDIAPDNIVLTRQDRPVLIDFGAVSRDLTQVSRVAPTRGIEKAGYTAPEQAMAEVRPEPLADIYSLGAVFYHALTGEVPIGGSRRHGQMTLNDEPDPLAPLASLRMPGVAPDMAAAVDACLSLQRKSRPPSVEDLRRRLAWGEAASSRVETAPGDDKARLLAQAQAPMPAREPSASKTAEAPQTGRVPTPAVPPSPSARGRRIRIGLLIGASVAALAAGGALVRLRVAGPPPRSIVPTDGEPSGDARQDRTDPSSAASADRSARQAAEAAQKERAASALAGYQRLVAACDRLAAFPADADRPPGVAGVAFAAIDGQAAVTACRAAVSARDGLATGAPDGAPVAASGGSDASAMRRTLFQLGRALEVRKLYGDARAQYERAIAAGSAAAMNNLGALYANGDGVARDYGAARGWFEKAAAAGNAAAMHWLGLLYSNGQGVAPDAGAARVWFERAAAAGSVDAMLSLAFMYASGQGVAKDEGAAVAWAEKAAAAGSAAAMYGLGEVYAKGQVGVTRDDGVARGWYEKAATAGNAPAMYEIGLFYANGRGGAQDDAAARGWYEKAAAAGISGAMDQLGALYANGQGVARDYAAARRWYEKAAAEVDRDAMYQLGLLYANGQGVARDDGAARSWFEKAAALGNPLASKRLDDLRGKRR